MKIIIITGALATGKSTFANLLSIKYHLLLLTKDHIKEILGDTIGFNNRDENLKLSIASTKIMMHVLEQSIKTNTDIILEANFHQNEVDYLKQLNKDILVLNFTADNTILYERFMNRINNENRHPVHQSAGLTNYDWFCNYIEQSNLVDFENLLVININADTFKYQNDQHLFNQIDSFLKK